MFCTTISLFVFLFFSHGNVSLFSIYEFGCPSGIFTLLLSKLVLVGYHLWIVVNYKYIFSISVLTSILYFISWIYIIEHVLLLRYQHPVGDPHSLALHNVMLFGKHNVLTLRISGDYSHIVYTLYSVACGILLYIVVLSIHLMSQTLYFWCLPFVLMYCFFFKTYQIRTGFSAHNYVQPSYFLMYLSQTHKLANSVDYSLSYVFSLSEYAAGCSLTLLIVSYLTYMWF